MDSDWKLIRLVWSTSNAIKSIWVKSFVITPDFIESIIWRYFYHFVPFFVPFVLLFGLLFIGRRILTREISVRLLYVCAQRSRQNSHSVFFFWSHIPCLSYFSEFHDEVFCLHRLESSSPSHHCNILVNDLDQSLNKF